MGKEAWYVVSRESCSLVHRSGTCRWYHTGLFLRILSQQHFSLWKLKKNSIESDIEVYLVYFLCHIFSCLSFVYVLTTIFKQLKFCSFKTICMVQCSVSKKGSLFQSMLLLINPNTRLLLMITAAAGKNVFNFNIFTALLHSILHFSYGTLLVKFQTEFLPWISS